MFSIVDYILLILVVLGAIGVVLSPRAIYSAMGMGVSFLSMAGLFFSWKAIFSGFSLLFVTLGGMLVVFLFVIFLLGNDTLEERGFFKKKFFWLTTLLVAMLGGFGLYYGLLVVEDLSLFQGESNFVLGNGIKEVAELVFSKYLLIVQLLGVLFLGVILGIFQLLRDKAS